jgi:hypothetical protein
VLFILLANRQARAESLLINTAQRAEQAINSAWLGLPIEEQVYREDAPGNAVVARARRWRPQVNGRRNDNKSNLLGRAEFKRRPRASKRSILEGYTRE